MRKDDKRMFPLFVDLTGKHVLVAGAGNIAMRRIKTLMEFGVMLTVVAPHISDTVAALADGERIRLEEREYREEDISSMSLVVAATDSNEVNEQIWKDCKARGIPVNVCSDKDLCDFHFPGVIIKDELTVGINASGKNHRKAKRARVEIENFLQGVNL